MNKKEFLIEIDNRIEKQHLLKHSFYKAWNAGELEKETIQEYAAQYFKHVSAFPRYISGIHSNCDDISIRQMLLENLNEEESGKENHPELWMQFAEGLGKKRDEVHATTAIEETTNLIDTFMQLSKNEKFHMGMGALYCYESMVPEIAENKIDGLKKFYGIHDEKTLKFFTVHQSADKYHRAIIRDIMGKICETDEKKSETLEAIDSALFALNNFLTGMQRVYC